MDNHGFTSIIGLREINIGPGDRLRLTYENTKSNPKYESELVDLLKKFKDCFAWPRSIDYLILGLKGSGATYQEAISGK